MKKTAKAALSILRGALIVILVFILVSNIYVIFMRSVKGVKQPAFLGLSHAVVLSGSMADAINTDDLVITKAEDSYNKGDIIMFDTGSSIVTHRIVRAENDTYTTKGDANNAEDPGYVVKDQVIGKVILTVPGAGKLVYLISSPLGSLVILAAGFLLIEGPYLTERKEKR